MRISHGHAEEFSFLGYFVLRRRRRGLGGHHAGLTSAPHGLRGRSRRLLRPARLCAVTRGDCSDQVNYPAKASADFWTKANQQCIACEMSSIFSMPVAASMSLFASRTRCKKEPMVENPNSP